MQKNILCRVKSQDCCGCGACANKCPVKAISLRENEEGFLAPAIDENLCTDCGLCARACPALNVRYENTTEPECYAAMAEDEIRMKSSSGGIFSLLAEHIIDKGGYVCGAAFNKDWSVSHIIIDNKQDLAKLRGSKYVQSDTENCYRETKKLLDAGKEVLFSGCPCQIAGLYSFLGKKYEKLFTVDILCHGTPSPGIWKKYLRETFPHQKIIGINFRNKEKIGWSCSHCTFSLKDGNEIVSDDYTKMFHNTALMRPSCENCKHSKLPRPADITLGDWWGIDKYQSDINDNQGLSFVLLNNDKGKKIFNALNLPLKQKISLKPEYNNGHVRFGLKLHPNRNKFFTLQKNILTDKVRTSYKKANMTFV